MRKGERKRRVRMRWMERANSEEKKEEKKKMDCSIAMDSPVTVCILTLV